MTYILQHNGSIVHISRIRPQTIGHSTYKEVGVLSGYVLLVFWVALFGVFVVLVYLGLLG